MYVSVSNYVRQRKPLAIVNQRTGQFQIRAPSVTDILPEWALECLSKVREPKFDLTNFAALDMHVLEPGTVRIKGTFLGNNGGIVIDDYQILCLSRAKKLAIALVVQGKGRATLYNFGPID